MARALLSFQRPLRACRGDSPPTHGSASKATTKYSPENGTADMATVLMGRGSVARLDRRA
jgi:hypothetical protein